MPKDTRITLRLSLATFQTSIAANAIASFVQRRSFDGELPFGVTAHSRTDEESVYVFLQNYTTREQKTDTSHRWITADDKREVSGEIILKPFETLILSRKV